MVENFNASMMHQVCNPTGDSDIFYDAVSVLQEGEGDVCSDCVDKDATLS